MLNGKIKLTVQHSLRERKKKSRKTVTQKLLFAIQETTPGILWRIEQQQQQNGIVVDCRNVYRIDTSTTFLFTVCFSLIQ